MIIPATHADEAAVIALWEACGLTRPWNSPEHDFRRAIAGPASDILIVRDGAVIVGSVMVGEDGHRGWVYYLAVAPDRRRGGTGRALMAAAEAWLRTRGVAKLQLMVRDGNAPALDFYAALGFAPQPVAVLGRFLDQAPMAPTLYGIPNCDTVKKARAWLDARQIAYTFHDYKKAGVDAAMLARAVERLGWDTVLNRRGTTFRKLPEAERADLDASGAIAIMQAHPSTIKRPLLLHGDTIEAGFHPDRYAAIFDAP